MLFRTIDGDHPLHAMKGDVIHFKEGNPPCGRCEDVNVWIAEGLDKTRWPGGFLPVYFPTIPFSQGIRYAKPGPNRYRLWSVDFDKLLPLIQTATLTGENFSKHRRHVADHDPARIHEAFRVKVIL